MGSLISLRIAFKYPDHVLGVVGISSTSRAATPEVLAAFQQFYDAWVSTPVPEEPLMELGILGWGGQPDVTSDQCREVKRNWTERYNGREKVEGIAESLNTRDDIVSRLSEISCPVLLIQLQPAGRAAAGADLHRRRHQCRTATTAAASTGRLVPARRGVRVQPGAPRHEWQAVARPSHPWCRFR